MTVLTDALPTLWHRDADLGVFSAIRHQVICLLMATCSSCLFTRTCSTDKQGNYFKLRHTSFAVTLTAEQTLHLIIRCLNVFFNNKKLSMCFAEALGLYNVCCRCWCSTLYGVS